MDFYTIRTKEAKGFQQAYPDWIVDYYEDLMVRGGGFYAVWDEERGTWSTNEYDIQRVVDADLLAYVEEAEKRGVVIEPLLTRNFGTGAWESFNRYVRNLPDASHFRQLDETLTFANTEVSKKDYVSKRLPYSLEEGKTDAWDELVNVLYSPAERDKIEWAIGAVVSGASKWIQKFLVFYGPPGSGKSTIIAIIERLFEGYVATFEAKALTSNNGTFAMEPFEHNPLVAIEHDSDLYRIETNTRLNSIVGHDTMLVNAKYRSPFTIRPNSFLMIGTNKPVKITDAKSGIMRRLIDVHPTGVKVSPARYHVLVENIKYELGAIALKCLNRYNEMGKFYYENYVPTKMMMLTDSFYNFIEANFDIFKAADGIRLKQIWQMYKEYCEEMNIVKRLQYHEVRDELHSYFGEFKDRCFIDDKEMRSVYLGFKGLPGEGPPPFVPDLSYVVELGEYDSAFDIAYPGQLAQYARPGGAPGKKWAKVSTRLGELDTKRLHYVKVPEEYIVIDFDLVDEDGEKDLERNIAAASKLPPTYAEVSKSGRGLHLHYIFTGDVHDLSSVLDVGIEIKTLLGDSALRRQLTRCNNLDISTISGGLPRKEKPVLDTQSIKTEKGLRALIDRNLRKEIHPGTKSSIDFIHHILEEAYDSGLHYDVSDLRPIVLSFAARSTNQSVASIRVVQDCKFASESSMPEADDDSGPIVFFDIEVYPNLFVVCWKKENDSVVVRMINPTSADVEPLLEQKLVGFNNRRYDNHILYAAYLGHSNEQLFALSQKLIDKDNFTAMFGEAYGLSYADIYDFSSKKQGLKKFQIELGIFHVELDLPWDRPVDESLWPKVVDYCVNDVISTEAVFNARKQDFVAREILASLSGLSVNHTTQQHTASIIFGDDSKPQSKFRYTDLSVEFPGYVFDGVKSHYHDDDPGEGGYVYSEPGYYTNVAVLDVASMHPTSIRELNLFGPYTSRFNDLVRARLAIKRKEYEAARSMLDGKLSGFIGDSEDDAADLAYALKIVVNSVYGLTSAKFNNSFKDPRNIDNIVAKRGALFMIDLKNAVQDQCEQVIHIKTDSIKIPNATQEIIDFVIEFGRKYGYEFEHEVTYEKLCLINDAVYVARSDGKWTAVGAQFQHPYVFKELFSHEPVEFNDLCETKNVVKGRIYLDMSGNGNVSEMRHVGRTGSFMPVNYDGGTLWRISDDGKKYHVTGTSGYCWLDRDLALNRDPNGDLFTDMDYFENLKNEAIAAIERYVPIDEFVS
jgi:hypothetical protein